MTGEPRWASWMRRLGVRMGLGILPAALLMGGASWGEGSGRCHTVRSGDTLSAISQRYRVPLAKLRKLNAARLLRPLRVGTRLDVHPRATRAPAGRFGEGKGRMLRARPGQLRRENVAATRDRLTRMRDLDTVHRFRRAGLLVPVPAQTRTYAVVGVRAALRVARPWTRRFIEQLGAEVHRRFGTQLRITSLTRTHSWQLALGRINVNAAPAHGPMRSTHLTGATVDISKQPLSVREVDWLRQVLGRLTAQRLVLAIEELNEPHFHILVRRRYGNYATLGGVHMVEGGC